MNRRKFLTLSVATAMVLPLGAWATDYRTLKPTAWTAKSVPDAVKGLYGDVDFIKSDDIALKMPKIASNGGAVPVRISSDIKAKSVALFQDSNPESAVAVWDVAEDGIIDYTLKLKLKKKESGVDTKVVVVVEGVDGKFYTKSEKITVSIGGCEG